MGRKIRRCFGWYATEQPQVVGIMRFRVDYREEVDAFHSAAMAAGGTDNGPPGLRSHYGPDYYAAFVKDPEENNIEVVSYAKGPRRN